MIVARNPASAKKANSYAERLRVGIAVIHGELKDGDLDEIDGRYSPPLVPRSGTVEVGSGIGLPPIPLKEKPNLQVVGDVEGHIAIMVVSG